MKRSFFFLPFLLFLAGLFTACEEVEEATEYDNWRQRNEAFRDSIAALAAERLAVTMEQADNVPVGELFMINNVFAGTNVETQYIYCKKLTENPEGERPLWGDSVNVYAYSTLINGVAPSTGNFEGYGALDKYIPIPPEKAPTAFDAPSGYRVSTSSSYSLPTTGLCMMLQYMRAGERWMAYVPWGSAYGTSGSSSILGYSMLTYDIVLEKVME